MHPQRWTLCSCSQRLGCHAQLAGPAVHTRQTTRGYSTLKYVCAGGRAMPEKPSWALTSGSAHEMRNLTLTLCGGARHAGEAQLGLDVRLCT